MLHLLPDVAQSGQSIWASTTASALEDEETPRTAKGLRKQIREDVCDVVRDVVRGEYQALHLLLEERLQRTETNQGESLRNQVLETHLQRMEEIQREALRDHADLIKESVRKYEKTAETTIPRLLPAAVSEYCKLSELQLPEPRKPQLVPSELQPLKMVPDAGPPAGSMWSKNDFAMSGNVLSSVAQVHPTPTATTIGASSAEETATKTAVEEEPEPAPCQSAGATATPKKTSGGIQALTGASGWGKAAAEEEQEQTKLRTMKSMTHLRQSGFCGVSLLSPEVRRRLLDTVLHPWFDCASGAAILSNAMFMGVKTQVLLSDAKNGESNSSAEDAFATVEVVFTVIFIIEWLMRLGAFQRLFFSTKERAWHLFDTILILAGIGELFINAVTDGGFQGGETMILRVLRIIRLMRLLRILRVVSVFRELRVLISGLLGSTRSLLWSVVLLGMVLYLFGIFFEQGVLTYLADGNKKAVVIPRKDELLGYFGSIQVTMVTMFGVISGGEDWLTVMSPLSEISGFYTFAFVVYIFVTTNGILHVIVGIFVESTMEATRNDKDLIISDELARKDSYMAQMSEVLRETDSDQSGTISWEEFQAHLDDPRVIAYFAALELDVVEARGLFELLDTEECDEVPIDEFVVGCFRLKGGAKGIDLAALMYENKKMMKAIKRLEDMSEDRLGAVDQTLASLTQFLPKAHVVKQGTCGQPQGVPTEIS